MTATTSASILVTPFGEAFSKPVQPGQPRGTSSSPLLKGVTFAVEEGVA